MLDGSELDYNPKMRYIIWEKTKFYEPILRSQMIIALYFGTFSYVNHLYIQNK